MGLNFIDGYSLLHFASGIIAYHFGIKFHIWFIIHALFEIIENSKVGMNIINKYLVFWPGGKPSSDSIINSIGDQTFAMLGWYVAYLVMKHFS
jgi:hypothetical protein